jgi:hypothetical protein
MQRRRTVEHTTAQEPARCKAWGDVIDPHGCSGGVRGSSCPQLIPPSGRVLTEVALIASRQIERCDAYAGV